MKAMVIERRPESFDDVFMNALHQSKLIGVHGRNHSGKTRLIRDLISHTGGTHIEVDDHLEQSPDGRRYLERVKAGELMQIIRMSQKPVFLDSFIVLDVLEKINVQADYLIFCERLTDVSNFRFNQALEKTYDDYEERRDPRDSASKIFTFNLFLV
jgi:hypothetical protein